VALIVAGGSGVRFGDPHGKQFAELCGRPLIAWSLIAYDAAPSIAHIVVVCAPDRRDEIAEIIAGLSLATPVSFADAGEVRQESVSSGLAAMPKGYAFCAIHDAARPLIETDTIERSVAVLRADPSLSGSLVSKRVTDTLKLVEDGTVVSTPDRSFYWSALTPQVFRMRAVLAAHRSAVRDGYVGTDDASLVERVGGRVRCVESPRDNIKVTLPEDLAVAEASLRQRLGAEGCGL
jgi:2-C-methyl-D-erythritol 4-phosphate cytidylyltransferase